MGSRIRVACVISKKRIVGARRIESTGRETKRGIAGAGGVGFPAKVTEERIAVGSVVCSRGDARRLVSDQNFYNYSVNLSADDRSLLAIEGQNQCNIWLAPAGDLSRAKRVTFTSMGQGTGVWLDWTPDGRIVFTGGSGVSRTIWMMNSDGSEQKQLIPSGRRNVAPSVTGDGRYLVFQSDRSGKTAVWRANLEGGDLRQLTDAGAHPDVSPDGKWIVYDTSDFDASDDDDLGEIFRVSIDGGNPSD